MRGQARSRGCAEFAAFLLDEVVADVGHAQWVFTVPKLLRPYFMHHRELLGPLCTAAWQTARELMAVTAGEEKGFRPGTVAMSQTFGDQLNLHPHVHALVTRGGWTGSGEWGPVPYVCSSAAEGLFRHKVISLLQRAGLLDEDRTRLLLSWHHSGFNVHNFVTVSASDCRALESLARYCLRNPVSLARLRFRRGWAQLLRRVYEIDPLVCPPCQGVRRVASLVTDGRVIRRILDHLGASASPAIRDRVPPLAAGPVPD